MSKKEDIKQFTKELENLKFDNMYEGDFFLTWEKSRDELDAVFTVANALRNLRERNISTKIFDSGLGVSLFRDNSTRTRFSAASGSVAGIDAVIACSVPPSRSFVASAMPR